MESTGNEHHGTLICLWTLIFIYLCKLKYGDARFVSDCDPVIKMLERTATIREDIEVSKVLFIKNCLEAVLYCNKFTFKDGGKVGKRPLSMFLNVNVSITQSAAVC
ncbi:hypothetical protein TNCV_4693941 [Trichonephila clavipes]|uniref:Uncharacterized protein n=1 Tax=Trichonephila clavipes TaxID=2585209 RepID=A0A8X6WB08_TRICX|nr:hypothetical protein TNCV_4693941 [Trichonephila clavipes]